MIEPQADQPCPCRSGRLYEECCGRPDALRVLALSEQRSCGACQACCHLLGIEELGKPAGINCEHQCSAGCGTYAQRPYVCHAFLCEWKISPHMSGDMRPDKSGIMYFIQSGIVPGDSRDTLKVFEVREGAFQTAPAAIYAELNRCRLDHPEISFTYIPFGKHRWNGFPTAPQYPPDHTERGHVIQFSSWGYLFADSLEEATRIHATLRKRHLENMP